MPFDAFAVDARRNGVAVRADGYAEPDASRYAAAIDFAVREALRLAKDHNAQVETRERARH